MSDPAAVTAVCEVEKAALEIGIEPIHCNNTATVLFPYGPWKLCGEHAGLALFAGLRSETLQLPSWP